MTFGKPLGNLRWEMVAGGANPVIRDLELSVPPPDFWGGRRGWGGDLITREPPVASNSVMPMECINGVAIKT